MLTMGEFIRKISYLIVLSLVLKGLSAQDLQGDKNNAHLLFTGILPVGPYGNVGLDAGYDFMKFSDAARLTGKFSGQYTFAFDVNQEIGSKRSAFSVDAAVNFGYRLTAATGYFTFFVGPTMAVFQEKIEITYKPTGSKSANALTTDSYSRLRAGYNFGCYFHTPGSYGFMVGLSWTGLFKNETDIAYVTPSGANGVSTVSFVSGSLFELMAGAKF